MEHSLKLAAVGYQGLRTHESQLLCSQEEDVATELCPVHITAESMSCRKAGHSLTYSAVMSLKVQQSWARTEGQECPGKETANKSLFSPLGSLLATRRLQATTSISTSAGLSGWQKKQRSRYRGEDSRPASLHAQLCTSARCKHACEGSHCEHLQNYIYGKGIYLSAISAPMPYF